MSVAIKEKNAALEEENSALKEEDSVFEKAAIQCTRAERAEKIEIENARERNEETARAKEESDRDLKKDMDRADEKEREKNMLMFILIGIGFFIAVVGLCLYYNKEEVMEYCVRKTRPKPKCRPIYRQRFDSSIIVN